MSDFQQEILHQVKKFCLNKIEPYAESDDHDKNFRMEVFKGLGELGLTGVVLPEQYGGANLQYGDYCKILEEIAKYSVAYAVTLSVSTMVQSILNEFGTNSQKEKYLPALTAGNAIGAFCLSESHSGSDASALKTTAKKTKEGYILNGSKMWITSAGIAKTYIVMARTAEDGPKGVSAFIVEDGMKGLSFGKKENKMGWKASPTREVILDKCLVPKENLLANEGEGFKIAMSALDRGRFTIGSIAVGLAQRALDEAVVYSLGRQQFGQAIFDFQGLQWMMADMATEVECSRLLVQKAAAEFDSGCKNVKIASMAKMKATDTAMKITTDAVQIHGGVGYTTEYPVERFMRDAKVLQIVEGTNQIQKIVISRCLKKEYQK